MATITIYGASDDLVVVEGDLLEEFSFYAQDDQETRFIGISDGTLLRVRYDDDSIWRLTIVHQGTAEVDKQEAPARDRDNYSDRVTLTGDIEWVVYGTEMVAANV